jgi:PKD repeat protein
MLKFTGFRSWLLLFAGVVLLGAVASSTAGAAGFGELARFGSKGVGQGQFTEHGTAAEAFGVEPSASGDNVYVGDEPEEHLFRIQKLGSNGEFLGSASLKTKGGAESESGIEGVAIDPTEHRFYVLVVQTRSSGRETDPEVPVAGALYAFSTIPNGKGELEPAAGTTEGGILAGSSVFHPQSETTSQVLLEPSGIAVDPTTHDVIVMGREDREGAGQEPAYRVALERVKSTGALGARWVDNAESPFFEEGGSEEATSPAVSKAGKVYVIGGALETPLGSTEQIVEIPKSFGAGESPVTFVSFDSGAEELVDFPGIPQPLNGAGLSIAPNDTLWAYAKILNKPEGGGSGFRLPGALAFNPNGTEFGWTGGQSAGLGSETCVISFEGHPMVAAGEGQRVWMFDSSPQAPRVVEFGPNGSGCPTAKSSALTVSVAGHAVEPSKSVEPGAEVSLSSTLSQANAKEVKWSFGDGTGETTTNQHQAPATTHQFAGEGKFKVEATIATDDLATPQIVVERTVTVIRKLPTAKFTAVATIGVGEADKLDASKSTGSEGSAITEYKWDFGDGTSEATKASAVNHTYSKAGKYTVELKVLDANKRTSEAASNSITVNAPPPPPPPSTTTNSTSPPSTTSTTTPPPPPGNEVLAYKAMFAGTALTVSKTGSVPIRVDCAAQSSCTGSVTLRTLTAVAASKHKKAVLTLATGSFALAGGQIKALTLHLTAKGRAYLARVHTLRVRATIVARDSAGAMHTTQSVLTLHAAKAKHH